jgi:hypothetical protein
MLTPVVYASAIYDIFDEGQRRREVTVYVLNSVTLKILSQNSK